LTGPSPAAGEDLVEAWRRNCALNLLFLDALPDAALEGRYAPRTRSVLAQFAHMHSVRVYHLQAHGKAFLGGLRSYPRGAEPTRREVRAALVASAEAIAARLADAAALGRIPGWKGPPAAYLAYLVSHEGHHRGLAMAALRLSGHRAPDELKWGLWSGWNVESAPAPGPAKPPRKTARRAR
jgi:uncharacterized damage-inducible protein DinB